jgi:hypothetical protein
MSDRTRWNWPLIAVMLPVGAAARSRSSNSSSSALLIAGDIGFAPATKASLAVISGRSWMGSASAAAWSSPSASRYPRSDLDRELAAGSTLAVSGQSEGQPSDPGRRLYGLDVLGARLKRAICRSFLHQAVLAAIRRSGRNKSGVTANSRRGAI